MSGKLSAGSRLRACLLAGAPGLLAMAGSQTAQAQNLTPGIIGSTYTATYSDPDFPFNPPVTSPPCIASLTLECGVNPGFFEGGINPGPESLGFIISALPFPQQFTQVELDFVGAPPILDATLVPPFFQFAPTSVTFTPTSVTFSLQSFFPISFEPELQEVGVALTLPEPGSLAVLCCGLLGLGLLRRRQL